MGIPKHIGDAFRWVLLATIVGLSPLMGLSLLTFYDYGNIQLNKILYDGIIYFFSVTLISSVLIDYRFSKKRLKSPLATDFMFLIYPVTIICICMLSYAYCFSKCGSTEIFHESEVYARLYMAASASFMGAILFAFFAKALSFKSPARRKKTTSTP
jgi:hypothetical protein